MRRFSSNKYHDRRPFIIALLVYMIGITTYAWSEYQHVHRSGINAIDARLLTTVSLAETVLHEMLAHELSLKHKLPARQQYEIALKLQNLADRMDIAFVYWLVKREGKIWFIASNPTPKETSFTEYSSIFPKEYPHPPPQVSSTFTSGEVHFTQYRGYWGSYRSIFFPIHSISGEAYIVGVDIDIASVESNARHSVIMALGYGISLALLILPLVYSYIRTVRRHHREQLRVAQTHPTTGLPNKRMLETRLDEGNGNSLLLIDISNFEAITNVVGVATADDLILRLSYFIKDMNIPMLRNGTLFHVEDQQFAFCSDTPFTPEQLHEVSKEIYGLLSDFHFGQEDAPPLLLRIGSVSNQVNAHMFAQMALVHARNTNQSIVAYEPSLDLPAYFKRYIDVLDHISHALRYSEIRVMFQPVVQSSTGRVVKFEALARIVDNSENVICSPDDFMPVAYQSRLCIELTRTVLDYVIEKVKENGHIVSINLSVKDLFDTEARNYIVERLRKSGVGKQIEFELLEQQVIGNYDLAASHIEELRKCCRGVGLDDVGKLYSNFDRLLQLPLDFVKIDGVVVAALERDGDAEVLVDGIVKFAKVKGIAVVAEHCSNEAICNLVTDMGIDMLQGFYMGVPSANFEVTPQRD